MRVYELSGTNQLNMLFRSLKEAKTEADRVREDSVYKSEWHDNGKPATQWTRQVVMSYGAVINVLSQSIQALRLYGSAADNSE